MADDLVTRGLGGDGPIATGGLGATTPASPGTIYGHCGGSASSTATLTDANAASADPTVGSIARLGGWRPTPTVRPVVVGALQGHAVGASLAAGALIDTYDADLAAVLILLDLELMLTEGAML
jgi:hypothetical protein